MLIINQIPGDSVSHSLFCSLLPSHHNLLVIKSNIIQIFNCSCDKLSLLYTLNIHARIVSVQKYSQPTHSDSIILTTDKLNLFIIKYSNGKISTCAAISIKDSTGRPIDHGHLHSLDPLNRCMALHLYQGLLKIIPFYHSGIPNWTNINPQEYSKKGKSVIRNPSIGDPGSPIDIRIKELSIISIAFLHSDDPLPQLALIYSDINNQRHFITYSIDLNNQQLIQSSLSISHIDNGSSIMIPINLEHGAGVLIIGQQSITFVSNDQRIDVPINSTIITSYTSIDSTSFLLSDHLGVLYSLVLQIQNGIPVNITLLVLGETAQASCLAYLSDNIVFVGSHFGDSQLISLQEEKDELNNHFKLLEAYPNLAPISDFCIVDIDNQGQGQVVTCSGAYKDGSLRIIRNGIGIDEMGSLEDLPGLTGLWSLRSTCQSKLENILILSFVSETRFQTIQNGSLDELVILPQYGFVSNEPTIFCKNVLDDLYIQITHSKIQLIRSSDYGLQFSWNAPPDSKITAARGNSSQIILAMTGCQIIYLEIKNSEIICRNSRVLNDEIACLDLPFDESISNYCAIGTWTNVGVQTLMLPSLDQMHFQAIDEAIAPRSVLVSTLDNITYLMTGLGDGTLYSFVIDPCTGYLSDKKKIVIGTQQIGLQRIELDGKSLVLASSDNPTIIQSERHNLRFSNINIKELSYICSFNTDITPNAMAFLSKDTLKIGAIESSQRLHIRSIPLGETPRRISYLEKSKVFGVICTKILNCEDEISSFKLIDDQLFSVLDVFYFEKFEIAQSLLSFDFPSKDGKRVSSVFIVGTAFVSPNEDEPSRGRILVFAVSEQRKIRMLSYRDVNGCVYSLAAYENDKLVAGVNSRVQLFRVDGADILSHKITPICSYHGYIVALAIVVRNTYIVVGDLMKSVSILIFDPINQKLKESSRDYETNWITALEVINEENVIAADNAFNIFTLNKYTDADGNSTLIESGQYHNGELINCFRRGSLALKSLERELPAEPLFLYGTVNGSIGVVSKLDSKYEKLLTELEKSIAVYSTSIGNINHSEWRTFASERGRNILEPRNIVDGDMIERFLEFNEEQKEFVFNDVKSLIESPNLLIKLIEDLSRNH